MGGHLAVETYNQKYPQELDDFRVQPFVREWTLHTEIPLFQDLGKECSMSQMD